jgi:hypothetical protein
MLWIHGLAGSGKSTLSTTIANTFRDSGQLGAFLFFDRDVTERSDPMMVISTLAHQLGITDPRVGAAMRNVIERFPNILMSPLPLQFQRLILDPLSGLEPLSSTIVIIFDGLDECGTSDEHEALLAVLVKNFVNLPSAICTVVTSRAEIDICNAFKSQHHILAYELDITSPSNSDDILSYFRHRMSIVRNTNKSLRLESDWPGEDALRWLVQRASGLFVWASAASKFIDGHAPRKHLDVEEVASGAEAELDTLYRTALESIGHWDDEGFIEEFRDILGVILVARQPISRATINVLLQRPEPTPSMRAISLLGSLLQQSPTVRVLHPSFADFLMTKDRCGRDIWFFGRSSHHRDLAFRCLDRMDAVLKRNMCNMTLDALTTESLSEDVSYSCLFWIDHICAVEEDIMPLMYRLRDFVFLHLLHWFEAMSIMRRPRDTISRVDHLLNWILVSHCPAYSAMFR